jgi:hypothetical protein
MTLPKPSRLRLVCRLPGARAPTPPFGLDAFEEGDAAAVAVLLDFDAERPLRAQVDEAAAQIPDAKSLPDGRLVVVLAERANGRGLLGRLLGGRTHVPRIVRATALLARGYREIGAGADEVSGTDLVWGTAEA